MLPFVVNVPSEISISKNRLGEIKVRSQMRSSLLKNSAAKSPHFGSSGSGFVGSHQLSFHLIYFQTICLKTSGLEQVYQRKS